MLVGNLQDKNKEKTEVSSTEPQIRGDLTSLLCYVKVFSLDFS